jgi:hypothetical protein
MLDVQSRLADSVDRDKGSTSWDEDDEIDAIVQRNISEVIQAADNAGTSRPHYRNKGIIICYISRYYFECWRNVLEEILLNAHWRSCQQCF